MSSRNNNEVLNDDSDEEEEEEEEDDDGNGSEDDEEEDDEGGGIDEEEGNERRPRKKIKDESNIPLFERLQNMKGVEEEVSSSYSSNSKSVRKRIKDRRKNGKLPFSPPCKSFTLLFLFNPTSLLFSSSRTAKEDPKKMGRSHKNGPAEMRSDRPVRRLRDNADNSTRKWRDPRFSEVSGKLKHDKFLKSYKFLDEYQVGIFHTQTPLLSTLHCLRAITRSFNLSISLYSPFHNPPPSHRFSISCKTCTA